MVAVLNRAVYNPIHKPNQLICGHGQVAIVTGWYLKEAIARKLSPQNYAVIGQLYSPTRGIDFLIRNLLFNPQVRYLVILNATKEDRNAGGSQCLLDFFERGYHAGKNELGLACWQVNSEIRGYIDQEIPEQCLEQLRLAITVKMTEAIAPALEQVLAFGQVSLPPWGTPQTFPKLEPQVQIFPGVKAGHRLEAPTIATAWVQILQRIRRTGQVRNSAYDSQWQELLNLMVVITDEPEDYFFPEPNYLPVSRDFLPDYIALTLEDAPFQVGVKYTYGSRMRSHFGLDQVEQAILALKNNPDSTRVVISLWDAKVDSQSNSSPPCLNHIWLRISDQKLLLTATFRSNDMFSAWVANAFGLRALQKYISDRLPGITVGELITISESAHIYDDCWQASDRIVADHYFNLLKHRDFTDPLGSFVITLQDQEILLEHISPGTGEVLDCFSDRSAQKLYQKLAALCPNLQTSHALYLGTELQKAELALQLGLNYRQDQKLHHP